MESSASPPRRVQYAPAAPGNSLGGTALRLWLLLLGLVIAGTIVAGGAFLGSKSCESPEFRDRVLASLEQRLQAEVEIGAITSPRLFHLRIPAIRIRSADKNWACTLQEVSLEVDPGSLFASNWRIRQLSIQSAQAWIGHVPPDPPPLPESGRAANESELFQIAKNLGLGLPASPDTIAIDAIKVAKFEGAIGRTREGQAPLNLASQAKGAFQNGTLLWELAGGQIQFRRHQPWKLASLTGKATAQGIEFTSGVAQGPRNASIEVNMINQSRDGQLLLAVEGKNLSVAGQYANEQDNPLRNLMVSASGQFHSQDLRFENYLFTGRAEFSGIELGHLPLFQLFANQTGESAFGGMSATKATADLEWEPGLLVLKRLQFEEPNLIRLHGELQAMETGLRGSLELALPAVLAGKFPGGKPEGFSYPAGGWSRAMVTVTGRANQWNEDLTERLLAQVSTDLGISPVTTQDPLPTNSHSPPFERVMTNEEAEGYDELFNRMLGVGLE